MYYIHTLTDTQQNIDSLKVVEQFQPYIGRGILKEGSKKGFKYPSSTGKRPSGTNSIYVLREEREIRKRILFPLLFLWHRDDVGRTFLLLTK